MYLVAVETSSAQGSIALCREGELLAVEQFTPGLVHGREVTPRIRDLLRRHGLEPSKIGALAVSLGPGSYTGVRVGVTAVKTLAFALEIPVVGVSSLEVIATGLVASGEVEDGESVAVVLDGRQRMLYWSLFDSRGGRCERVTADSVLDLRRDRCDHRFEARTLVVGDGAELFAQRTAERLAADDDESPLEIGAPELAVPRASALAAIATSNLAESRNVSEGRRVHELVPIYLRPSEAERRFDERAAASREPRNSRK